MSRPKASKDKNAKAQSPASEYNSSDAETEPPVPTASVRASFDVTETMPVKPCQGCRRAEVVDEKNSDWFCAECDEFFCDECRASHKRFKQMANHSIASTHERCSICHKKSKDAAAICYCKKCAEFLCIDCKSNHQDFNPLGHHKTVEIQEHVRKSSKKNSISGSLRRMGSTLRAPFKSEPNDL